MYEVYVRRFSDATPFLSLTSARDTFFIEYHVTCAVNDQLPICTRLLSDRHGVTLQYTCGYIA